MAFSETEIEAIEKTLMHFLEVNRPPEEMRNKLDLTYKIEGQSVFIMEIRPRWDKPEEVISIPIVKTSYIKSKDMWKIFWMRGTLKWEHYEPIPYVKNLSDVLDVVKQDSYGCFFG